MKNKVYLIGITAFLLVWFGLTGAAWFGKAEAYSKEERKTLSLAPQLTAESLTSKDPEKSFLAVRDLYPAAVSPTAAFAPCEGYVQRLCDAAVG